MSLQTKPSCLYRGDERSEQHHREISVGAVFAGVFRWPFVLWHHRRLSFGQAGRQADHRPCRRRRQHTELLARHRSCHRLCRAAWLAAGIRHGLQGIDEASTSSTGTRGATPSCRSSPCRWFRWASSCARHALPSRKSSIRIFVQDVTREGAWPISVLSHAIRNALPQVLTVMGLQLGYLVGGSILVETIFRVARAPASS